MFLILRINRWQNVFFRGLTIIGACIYILLYLPAYSTAGTGTNEAFPAEGTVLLNPSGPVTVSSSSGAATSAVAEIDPLVYTAGTAGAAFTFDVLPLIDTPGGDTGVDRVTITAPAGYSNLAATSLSLGGSPQNPGGACPVAGAGEYCTALSGQTIAITFGDKLTLSGVDIRVGLSADLPGLAGSGVFIAGVDDSATAPVPMSATSGNADGDSTDGNSLTVNLLAAVSDTLSSVIVSPAVLKADGIEMATVTVTLRDGAGQPVSGKAVTLSSDRGAADLIVQPAGNTDAAGQAVATIQSNTIGGSVLTVTNVSDGLVLADHPTVYFTKGEVLRLTKSANKRSVSVGEVVTYAVTLANDSPDILPLVSLQDSPPPNLKYLKGSARLNGLALPDPAGNNPLLFSLGAIPALIDGNGNGRADAGETGFMTLSYQMVVGSGARPGEYINRAVAVDACPACYISNSGEARVAVVPDPHLDLGTIIGKVFEDANGDGWQDKGEEGVGGVMVVLDDGSYVLTDDYGRYHFPALSPGQRLLKINLGTLPGPSAATMGETKVVSLTEGMLAKANFGIQREVESESIGSPAGEGVEIKRETIQRPLNVVGNVESFILIVNGRPLPFSTNDVIMRHGNLPDVMEIKGDVIERPVRFEVSLEGENIAETWAFNVWDGEGKVLHLRKGEGSPPPLMTWDGRGPDGELLKAGEIYQYQITLSYEDGSSSDSARRYFGVNRTSAISLQLRGSAFRTGSSELSGEAASVLKDAAELIRKYPGEKVFIEGHSDSTGAAEVNMRLSERRAESARRYLVDVEGIEEGRLFAVAYGETRPVADNGTPEGREMNRRVEIKGTFQEVDRSKLYDQYRTAPFLKINDKALPLDERGRFSGDIEVPVGMPLAIEGQNSQGRSIRRTLKLPSLEITAPRGTERRPFDPSGKDVFECRLQGRTEPGNSVEFDGNLLPLSPEGLFEKSLSLERGENRFGLMVSDAGGISRISELVVAVSDRDEGGLPVIAVTPVPELTVDFPPSGAPLASNALTLMGKTTPGNRVYLNDRPVSIEVDGRFSTLVNLPSGKSLLDFRVEDGAGNSGHLRREVEVPETKLFFLAFADGKMGKLTGKGNLGNAGMSERSEYYTEGRLAYYLKGVIAGKYLITSAFDSGTKKFDQLFDGLDEADNDRFFTNLDPDKLYPVYGDTSEIVYDSESQGKFYLAIESDEIDLLVGNYALKLDENELASYRRTLYGGRFAYRSAATTRYGDPHTKILLFGAEVRQVPVRDQLRATGSALYYLSRREIIEGSEQVFLVVKDKNTGLVLSRRPQQRDIDYRVKYTEGRILFNGPVSTVSADSRVVDSDLLAGNPVYIEVDYESRVDSFEKTALGMQAQKQLGDHVAVGGTLISDELSLGRYELQGVNAVLRPGEKSRLTAEVAESNGTDAFSGESGDGGMTFSSFSGILSDPSKKGRAWKLTAETEGGGVRGSPGNYVLGGYLREVEEDFVSADTTSERGTRKFGINGALQLTKRDDMTARFDRSTWLGAVSPDGMDETDQMTLKWRHKRDSWKIETEYFSFDSGGGAADRKEGAVRLENDITKKLKTYLERQETLEGPENDQTSAGFEYGLNEKLTLSGGGTEGSRGSSRQGGAVLKMGDGRAYLTRRQAEDRGGRMDSTIVGAEGKVDESTRVYTEYQWADLNDRGRNVALAGAEKSWRPAEGLKFLLSGERSEIEDDTASSWRYSLWAGLYYATPKGMKASTKNGMNRERGVRTQDQYLTSNHFEFRLTPDFTFLSDFRWSETKDRALGAKIAGFREGSLGVAYRPVESDRLNALMRYTRLQDERPFDQVTAEQLVSETEVFSAEWSFDLNRHFEWVEKEAIKTRREKTGTRAEVKTHTLLSVHRINVHISKSIDIGTEYRTLRQKEASDRRKGWLAEATWEAVKHLRLGIGYNFTDFSDNEFSDNSYSVEGPFVRLQAVF